VIASVSEFLDEVTKSSSRVKLLNFFYENPFAMDSAKNLSRWINNDLYEVEKDLEELVKLKVVERIGEGSSAIYSYTQNLEVINMIDRFIQIMRGKKYG